MEPRPHVFVQSLEADGRLLELGQRAEAAVHRTGHVVAAPYLEPAPGWLGRVARGLSGEGFDDDVRLRLPFTTDGDDALGYFSSPSDTSVVRVTGIVHGGSVRGPVVRDLWVTGAGTFRACETIDFAVIDPQGASFVVTCGLAPIVIAEPRPAETDGALEELHPRTQQLVQKVAAPRGEAQRLEVRPGDTVELLGLARPLAESARRIDLDRLQSPYRDRTPPRPGRVIGDEDGTRVVLRTVPRALDDTRSV